MESLARLLGHSLLQTTQRYIDGANPALYAEFAGIMAKLETTLIRDKSPAPLPPQVAQQVNPSRSAPESELLVLRQRLEELPTWLAEAANMYLSWRCYFPVIVFGNQGEAVAKYVTKGRQVLVEGRVQVNDKGYFNVVADWVQFGPEAAAAKEEKPTQ